MEEQFPQRFGPFVLLRLLGVGGMGKAYLARHDEWQGRLVVKRMHGHLSEDETLLKRFIHEAQVATCVRHPNVAALVAMGTVEGEPFFATEYVFGLAVATLVERIEAGAAKPIPLPVALHFGVGIAAGVEAVHEARNLETGEPLQLVHRDIGARNVLVGSDGRPRLIDLGLGKSSLADWQTATNLFAGSPDYMPPEQALGRHVDRRADVYAAAVTIWELITGRKRIREPGIPQRIARAIEAQPEPLCAFRREASPRLEQVLQQAMAPDAERRTPTATMLRLALVRELAEVAPDFDGRAAAAWLETSCGTALAKEQRLLEEAEASDGGTDGGGGLTRILVAHRMLVDAAPVATPARAPVAPAAATVPPSRAATVAEASNVDPTQPAVRTVPKARAADQTKLLGALIGSAVVVVVLAILVLARAGERDPVAESIVLEPIESAAAPPAAPPSESVALDPPAVEEQEPDPTPAPVAQAGADDPVRMSPALVAKKQRLVGRIRELRRTRFDVAFQRKLTDLSARLTRARSEESLAEVEARLSRLEKQKP